MNTAPAPVKSRLPDGIALAYRVLAPMVVVYGTCTEYGGRKRIDPPSRLSLYDDSGDVLLFTCPDVSGYVWLERSRVEMYAATQVLEPVE